MRQINGGYRIGQVLLSSNFKVVGINPYAQEVLGVTSKEIGKSIYHYHSKKSHDHILAILENKRPGCTDIPAVMIIDVPEKVLMINFCRLETIQAILNLAYSTTFVDITRETQAKTNPLSGKMELKRLPVWHKDAHFFLDVIAIYAFGSDGNYCKIYTKRRSYYPLRHYWENGSL
jgi:hypothetical protein